MKHSYIFFAISRGAPSDKRNHVGETLDLRTKRDVKWGWIEVTEEHMR